MTQKINIKKIALFLALFFCANNAEAADTYVFDPNHTNITWSANNYGFSDSSGKFTKASGLIVIDEANPQNSSVAVTIRTDSVQTGITEFDNNLKGPDFLNVAKSPEAQFISRSLIRRGRIARITGDFTFLGITKEISLDARLNKIGINNSTKKKTVGFSAGTVIKRSDYGMTFGFPGISDNVKINIEVEAILDNSGGLNSEDNNKSMIDPHIFDEKTFKISPNTSSITVSGVKDGSSINGFFRKFEGKVGFDPNNLDKAVISIDLDVSSISISNGKYDSITVLKTSDWLDFVRFPKANFTATKFILNPSTQQYIAKGTMRLKGRALPMDIAFNILNYSDAGVIATGSFNIKRSDFGIGSSDLIKAGNVQDNVQVKFNINAERQAQTIPFMGDNTVRRQ